MKKIISLVLLAAMLIMALASCADGDKETTTAENSGTTTQTESSTTTDTTTDTTLETTTDTTIPTTDATTTQGSASETTTVADNDVEYNENGILKSYVGAIDTTTFDANPDNVYHFTANEMLKYDATVVIYFTESCGFCKSMILQYLSPLYEAKKNVLVIGILHSPRINSGAVQSIGQFKKNYKVNFPTIISGYYGDNGVNSAAIMAHGTSVPQTYVLNNKGKLVASYAGWAAEVGQRINRDIALLEAQNQAK